MDDQKRFVEVRYLCKSEQGREGDEGDGARFYFRLMLAKEGAIETSLRMRPAEAARSLHRKPWWKSSRLGRHDSNIRA